MNKNQQVINEGVQWRPALYHNSSAREPHLSMIPYKVAYQYRSLSLTLLLFFSLSLSALIGCDDQETTFGEAPLDLPLLDLSVISACNDGRDNDQDDLIDFPDDPGCLSLNDIDERDSIEVTVCNDSLDNDNDGLIDFNDPGCSESEGVSEQSEVISPECNNGIDDDEDGYVDFPADESCLGPDADDESLEPDLTACNNQRDDDSDGLIDFPFDPGCASPQDLDERDDFNASMIAQCNDGIDNDQDGYADLADPQCSTPTDPRERLLDDEDVAVCSNGIDDDGDGLIDAHEDPGCIGPGDSNEEDTDSLPACSDGIDNDADGYVDYPEDSGCSSIGDREEDNPRVTPACLDGEDNDGDELFDYPQDPGCDSSADTTERGACLGSIEVIELVNDQVYRGSSRQGRFLRQASCGGQGAPELTAIYQVRKRLRQVRFSTAAVPNEEGVGWETTLYARRRCDESAQEIACSREPVDGIAENELIINEPPLGPIYLLIDGASGRGGEFELSVVETPIEACQNGTDDDDDGTIDFPLDPGCQSPRDEDESSPLTPPQCANGIDDDADDLIDYPNDIGCRAAFDDDELDECGQGIPLYQLTPPPSDFIGVSSADGVSSENVGACGGIGIEQVIRYDNPSHARLHFELYRTDGIAEQAYLYARSEGCGQEERPLGCATATIGDPLSGVDDTEMQNNEMPSDEMTSYGSPLTLQLDSVPQGPVYLFIDHDLEGFPFLLKTSRIPLTPMCDDGIDNDGDELIDAQDPGCAGPMDEDERDPEVLSVCHDGLDNDIDGWTDYPLDPGCSYYGGASEIDPATLPSCSNGIDDNGDGYTDFPYDIGCAARGDETEANLPVLPQCSNQRDDDEDGLEDFPQDPGCVARGDDNELDLNTPPHCADGVDNDLNGIIDYPLDPGCYAMGDPREQPTSTPPQCSDGIDNDQDGFTDLPYDPGCESSGDERELDPLITPQCANDIDDDGNGRTDWPDDPGCLTRADPREDAIGELNARCHDGVDNDDDGEVDLDDPQCQSRTDSSEAITPAEMMVTPDDYQCADGLDNDLDGMIDWPLDPGCSGRGDFCEAGGAQRCTLNSPSDPMPLESACVDLLSSAEHCGACGYRCADGQLCSRGQCIGEEPSLRSRLMTCGSLLRPAEEFFIGPLQGQNFLVSAQCDPDDTVQALLVTRSGVNGVSLNLSTIQGYLERGGIVITEKSIGPRVYGKLFNIPTFDSPQVGACRRNIQPLVNHRPQDPLWTLTPHSTPPEEDSGCGDDLQQLPGLIRVGGWDEETTSLGYRSFGQGRLWVVAADWRDLGDSMTDESRALMAAMISGGGAPRRLRGVPECMDLIDNDLDGYIDLFDTDCTEERDETEWSHTESSSLPECTDQIDNDNDGWIDFPYDSSCEAAGGLSEHSLFTDDPTECSDGIDNDGDGETDWPWDRACRCRGDTSESAVNHLRDCNNEQDDDGDGRIDFPADLGCLAKSWISEVSVDSLQIYPREISLDMGREVNSAASIDPGCSNLADDDRDGLVDFPADPQCTDPRDPDETGESSTLSLSSRSAGYAEPLPECIDGLDNDGDLLIDLNDPQCIGINHQGGEGEPSEILPLCGDEIDNDQDGLIDWPDDLDCLARGAIDELSCESISDEQIQLGESLSLSPLAPADRELSSWLASSPRRCGGEQSHRAGQLIHYTHQVEGGIRLILDRILLEERQRPSVSIGIQRGCGPQAQTILCQHIDLSSDQPQERMIDVPHLLPGDYLITINEAPLETWESRYQPVQLPPDPRSYQARNDVTSICWQDGGADSFDCMGRVSITWEGEALLLNVGLGLHTIRLNEQTHLRYSSDKPHPNLWRLRFWTTGRTLEGDELSVQVSGNLGFNGLTTLRYGEVDMAGFSIPYWWYSDDIQNPVKPPVFSMLVPHHGISAPFIESELLQDQVSLSLNDTQVPFTYYLASSYLPVADLLYAIEADLSLFDGRGELRFLPTEVRLSINARVE